MTQTLSLTTVRNISLALFFFALALFAFAPTAQAHEGESSNTGSSQSLEKEVKKILGSSLDKRSPLSIQKKIQQVEKRLEMLEKQKHELEALLARLQAAASSTSSQTGSSTKERLKATIKPVATTDTTPTLSGMSRNAGPLKLIVKKGETATASGTSYTAENIAVTDNAWSHTVTDVLPTGKYTVMLYGPETGTLPVKGKLIIRAGTGSGTVLGASAMSLPEALRQLAGSLMALELLLI